MLEQGGAEILRVYSNIYTESLTIITGYLFSIYIKKPDYSAEEVSYSWIYSLRNNDVR
jgi:hypothetical protein